MGKMILVTGASTGIGADTAVLLAKGNTIIVHYNSSKGPAEEVAKKVAAEGGKAFLVQADLRTEAGCRKVADFVGSNGGRKYRLCMRAPFWRSRAPFQPRSIFYQNMIVLSMFYQVIRRYFILYAEV